MKLVVGLGNPGRKYDRTRHNVGFEVVAEVARRYGLDKPRKRFQGEVVDAKVGETRSLLLCPHTYMNRSGGSVQAALGFFKLTSEDLLVVCDDLYLPLGKLRFRGQGSAGGQKGLADVIRCLGTDAVPRLRMGIGQPPASWDATDFVLSKFNKKEKDEMDVAIMRAADGVCDWVIEGTQFCMNRYNASTN